MSIEEGRDHHTSSDDDKGPSRHPLDDSARRVESLRAWSTQTFIEYGTVSSRGGAMADCASHDHTSLCPPVESMFVEAADPAISFVRLQQIHTEIVAMGCPACAGAFQMEMKIRSVLAVCSCSEAAPDHLPHRIVEQISRIDLTEIDVNDIDF